MSTLFYAKHQGNFRTCLLGYGNHRFHINCHRKLSLYPVILWTLARCPQGVNVSRPVVIVLKHLIVGNLDLLLIPCSDRKDTHFKGLVVGLFVETRTRAFSLTWPGYDELVFDF